MSAHVRGVAAGLVGWPHLAAALRPVSGTWGGVWWESRERQRAEMGKMGKLKSREERKLRFSENILQCTCCFASIVLLNPHTYGIPLFHDEKLAVSGH